MQTYRVRITRQAQEQLLEIRDYIQDTLLAPQAAADMAAVLRGSIGALPRCRSASVLRMRKADYCLRLVV